MIGNFIGFHPSFSTLLLRLTLGIIFIPHGYQKLFKKGVGTGATVNFFSTTSVPAPRIFTYIVGSIEFFGGMFLITGLLTRLIALVLSVNIIIGLITVKLKTGFMTRLMENERIRGYEVNLALLTIGLVLVFLGTGKFSLDFIVFHQW
jgi:putative oxidoreductase